MSRDELFEIYRLNAVAFSANPPEPRISRNACCLMREALQGPHKRRWSSITFCVTSYLHRLLWHRAPSPLMWTDRSITFCGTFSSITFNGDEASITFDVVGGSITFYGDDLPITFYGDGGSSPLLRPIKKFQVKSELVAHVCFSKLL